VVAHAPTVEARPSALVPTFRARPPALVRPVSVHDCDAFFESPDGELGSTGGAPPQYFYVTVQRIGCDKAKCFQLCPYKSFEIGREAARAQCRSVVFMFANHDFRNESSLYCGMYFESESKEQEFVLAILRAIRRDHLCAKFKCFMPPDGLALHAPYAALLAADQHGVLGATAAAAQSC